MDREPNGEEVFEEPHGAEIPQDGPPERQQDANTQHDDERFSVT